ncbi:MAG: hypothetical protein WKG01_20795 [Kofleriaceae bacterium]
MHTCELCNAKVHELRRGRCWGCYSRWVNARPVGVGARCVTCSEQRRRVLKLTELYGAWQPMCFNCNGQISNLTTFPTTLAALREAVSRERRAKDRRIGSADVRMFQYERRVGDRRAARSDYPTVDDDMIIEVTLDPGDGSCEVDFEELTSIRSLIALELDVRVAG